jgi:hypothetical protein
MKTRRTPSPKIKGNVEISKGRNGVLISGDPQGLRSLASLLNWLADVDQEAHPNMPDGEREHIHLYNGPPPLNQLTPHSVATEICRLDAKGTGEFPKHLKQKKRAKK